MANIPTKRHLVLLSSPGMGHLIPMLELGDRLITLHVDVTVIVIATEPSTIEFQLRKHSTYTRNLLKVVFLPPVDISPHVAPSTTILSKLVLMMDHSVQLIRSAIDEMRSTRPSALVVDLFGTGAFKIAEEFGMLKYVFNTSNAWFLAVTVYNPHLTESEEISHVSHRKPLNIPGCAPLVYDDTLDVYTTPENRVLHDDYVKIGGDVAKADGILVNSWEELEPDTLKALRDPKILARYTPATIYPIGPLIQSVKLIRGSDSDCSIDILCWLDRQPNESVLYVSFGSGGTLCIDQLTELAWGLEMSQRRFVWVVRPPSVDEKSVSYFKLEKEGRSTSSDDGTPDFLPDGFVTRTREFGLVVPFWAPQTQILGHRAVGGFLSHCGWNSTLESIANGVPMICWPLYAEQKMNARMLSEHLGMAVWSREVGPHRVVHRNVIERMVKEVMEKDGVVGKWLRTKVRQIKRRAEVASEKGGSSSNALSEVVRRCEIGMQGSKDKARGA